MAGRRCLLVGRSGYEAMIARPALPRTPRRTFTRPRLRDGVDRRAGQLRGGGCRRRPAAAPAAATPAPDRAGGASPTRPSRIGRQRRHRRPGPGHPSRPRTRRAPGRRRSRDAWGRRLAGRAGQVVQQRHPPELEHQHPEVPRVEQLDADVRVELAQAAQLAVLLAHELLLERRELDVELHVRQVEVRREALDHVARPGSSRSGRCRARSPSGPRRSPGSGPAPPRWRGRTTAGRDGGRHAALARAPEPREPAM